MNELSIDELIYYKIDDNLYSGGFKINSILNNSLHDSIQTGGNTLSNLAIPLGLYSTNSVSSPLLKRIHTSSETFVENNSCSNKRKTKKNFK